MASEHQQLFEAALSRETPLEALIDQVRVLLQEGYDRQALTEELQDFMLALRAQGRDGQEDIVLDVLDRLTGWASPGALI